VRNRLLYVCEFYSFAQRQEWIKTLPFGYETRRVIKSAGLLAHLDASGGRASVRDDARGVPVVPVLMTSIAR